MFFGDDLPAAEAERLGLVNRVVPADELDRSPASGPPASPPGRPGRSG